MCERCAAAAEAAEAGSRAAARPACDTCSKCGRPAEGESVEALGRVYHRACFCCAKCDERLPSAFRVRPARARPAAHTPGALAARAG